MMRRIWRIGFARYCNRMAMMRPGELTLKAERLLVSYSPLAHDVGFQGYRAFRIAASGL